MYSLVLSDSINKRNYMRYSGIIIYLCYFMFNYDRVRWGKKLKFWEYPVSFILDGLHQTYQVHTLKHSLGWSHIPHTNADIHTFLTMKSLQTQFQHHLLPGWRTLMLHSGISGHQVVSDKMGRHTMWSHFGFLSVVWCW